MRSSLRSSLPLALTAILTSSAAAGSEPVDPAAGPRVERAAPSAGRLALPADRVLHDVDEHGALWAWTARYKAAFDGGGARFVPFLGSDAPRNHPVGIALASARIGGVELALEAAGPVRDGDHIEYERGAFREVYALSPGSMEQSFVLDARPGAGELVVDVAIDTDLAWREDAAGFVLANERGGLTITRAVAFDAGGARVDLATRRTAAGYELRVPADFVAAARYPLVVDPTFTPFTVTSSSISTVRPDVSTDPLYGQGAFVVEYEFSATDHDIAFYLHDSIGGQYGIALVDPTGDDWRRPSIAFNATTRRYLVVAEVGALPLRTIRGRAIPSVLSGMGSQFTISSGLADHTSPDVGGDVRITVSSRFCVAWQREVGGAQTDVVARLLDGDGVPTGGTIVLQAAPGAHARHPSVSKSTGDGLTPHEWVVAWDNSLFGANRDVLTRRVSAGGALSAILVAAGTSADDAFPSASSLTSQGFALTYMVAFQRVVASDDRDVCATVFVGNAAAGTFVLTPGSTHSQIAPSVETDGTQFFTVHAASAIGSTQSDVRLDQWAWDESTLVNTTATTIGTSGASELWPQIALDRSSGSFSACGYVAWQVDDGVPADEVFGARYCGQVGGPSWPTCPGDGSDGACPCANYGGPGRGCANSVVAAGALLRATGVHATDWDTTRLEIEGVPPSATCLFFQGTQSHTPYSWGDGLRCFGGTIVRLGTKTASAGLAAYPVTGDQTIIERGQIPSEGALRHYQVWYRNPAPFFCVTGTYNFSNGVSIHWTR